MSDAIVTVHTAFDDEAGVRFVESSDLHGVNAEASTLDALMAKLPDLIFNLLDEGGATGSRSGSLGRPSAVDIPAHP